MFIHRFRAALAAVVLAIAPASQAQPASDHGLAPGETLVTLGDNCHVVRDLSGTSTMSSEDVAKYLAMFKTYVWKGDCHLGVAEGAAYFGPSTPNTNNIIIPGITLLERNQYTTFVHGRQAGPDLTIETRQVEDGTKIKEVFAYYNSNTAFVALNNISRWSKPSWGYSYYGKSRVYFSEMRSSSKSEIATWRSKCDAEARKGVFRGCAIGAEIYGVELTTPEHPKGVVTPCPAMTSAEGCEAVWTQVGADLMARARPVVAEMESREATLHARLDPVYGKAEQQIAIRKQQRLDAALAAQLAAAQASAAEQVKFKAGLKSLGAGQLFAKADEWRRAGDVDKANDALRALIERFPNSPLAGVAAQQLAGSSGASGAAAAAGRTSQPASSSASSGASCNSYIYQLVDTARAGWSTASNSDFTLRNVNDTHLYYQLASQIPACRGSRDLELLRIDWEQVKAQCRAKGGGNCETGLDSRAENYRAATRQAFDRIVASARNAGAPATVAAAPVGGCAQTPDRELVTFNNDINTIRAAHPMPGAAAGARATYQWMYAFSLASLQKLEPRRACLAHHYPTTNKQIADARDSARQGCEMLASVNGACPTTFP